MTLLLVKHVSVVVFHSLRNLSSGFFSSLAFNFSEASEPGNSWGLSAKLFAYGLELSSWSVDDATCSFGGRNLLIFPFQCEWFNLLSGSQIPCAPCSTCRGEFLFCVCRFVFCCGLMVRNLPQQTKMGYVQNVWFWTFILSPMKRDSSTWTQALGLKHLVAFWCYLNRTSPPPTPPLSDILSIQPHSYRKWCHGSDDRSAFLSDRYLQN